MRFNKDHSKNKTHIIGGFKLPYSLNGPSHKRKKFVNENDTKIVENLIGLMFVNYLRQKENSEILGFSLNQNDDNKNPEIYIFTKFKKFGAQITQIVINEYLSKFNQTKRICEKISVYINDIYKPPIKINIQIYPPWENENIEKAPQKVYKRLSKIIAKTIEENIQILQSKNEYLNFDLDKIKFGKVADSFNLYPVPVGQKSNYFGGNNIFIDYEFDDINISKTDIDNSVNKVYADKNGGNSEILIIWGDENQFMGTSSLIETQLKIKFETNTFESVYFLTFDNVETNGFPKFKCNKIY